MTRKDVYQAIDEERTYQDNLHGLYKHSITEWLLILERQLDQAKQGWLKNHKDRQSSLHEITQIAVCAVACLEDHGTVGNK